jgi:hypothetical protein
MKNSQQKEIFFLLSSKLEKTEAEEMTKKLCKIILKNQDLALFSDINMFQEGIISMQKSYSKKASLENVSLEGEIISYKKVVKLLEHRRNNIRDILISMLL